MTFAVARSQGLAGPARLRSVGWDESYNNARGPRDRRRPANWTVRGRILIDLTAWPPLAASRTCPVGLPRA